MLNTKARRVAKEFNSDGVSCARSQAGGGGGLSSTRRSGLGLQLLQQFRFQVQQGLLLGQLGA